MTSMLRDVSSLGAAPGGMINVDALRSAIRNVLITNKANTCPIAMRVAWHAAGTYDRRDGTGGCNGATMRFEPESSDPANAGLSIIRDLLHPVKKSFPEVSLADLYAFAGCVAIEFLGGPSIPFRFGRTDDSDGMRCPMNGRLPDASQGAGHLRSVFVDRMGFSDRDVVALSGAHTLGRCHAARSGFDGPWTTHPLRFDNEYFVNLTTRKWRPRRWTGPLQYEDEESGQLMMLPTDLALVEDPKFRVWVELYARDQEAWFRDFAQAYGRLLSLGCPAQCNPGFEAIMSEKDRLSAEFREHAMHGSVLAAKRLEKVVDVHQPEPTSGRTALHKAAFWGHNDMVNYLLNDLKLNPNTRDRDGDTPLHDASKFGHEKVVQLLLQAGADSAIKNNAGHSSLDIAVEHVKHSVIALLCQPRPPLPAKRAPPPAKPASSSDSQSLSKSPTQAMSSAAPSQCPFSGKTGAQCPRSKL